jgi:hypothetical protein
MPAHAALRVELLSPRPVTNPPGGGPTPLHAPASPRARAGCCNCGARHCGTHRPAVTARRSVVAVTALPTSTSGGGLRFACSSINFLLTILRSARERRRAAQRQPAPGRGTGAIRQAPTASGSNRLPWGRTALSIASAFDPGSVGGPHDVELNGWFTSGGHHKNGSIAVASSSRTVHLLSSAVVGAD